MARTERIMRLLDLLRGREAARVADLAAALGVSARTLHRDLATLRGQGMTLSSDTGPGGGVRLEADRGVTAVHLATDEVVALWLAATLSAREQTLPWSSAARAGLDKLFASVSRERARSMRALCERVVIGRSATPRVLAELGRVPSGLLDAFERSFREEVCLSFDYRDRHGATSRRLVEPHGLLVESPAWYVLARDVEREAARMFRMDRIRNPRPVPTRRFHADLGALHAQLEAERAAAGKGRPR